ncbi:MAG: dihydroxyacetone kinase subunit DhaK [Sporolactobacillus sp.]
MKKIINKPEDVVKEMLDGLAFVNESQVRRVPGSDIIVRRNKDVGKVALISGGGSGHEPSHAGFVGRGMLSAAVCGAVFTSPAPDQILTAIKEADQGAGVLMIVKNYTGDVMNFEMAEELAQLEDIHVAHVVVDDDVAVENSTYTAGRRGVAGTVLVHKVLGAAAEAGLSLEELVALGQTLISSIKTIGVALSAATVPESGKPGFELADDEMEYGVGIHSEPGYRREKIKPSAVIADELVQRLKSEFKWQRGDSYGVFVNGLGATPLMEQYVFINDVHRLLAAEQLNLIFRKVGSLMTSIDMAGLSLTLIHFQDERWVDYLRLPVEPAAW